jgi:transposase
MESVELYRQLLGLTAPWAVERVELDIARGCVKVYVGHLPGQRLVCPKDGQELVVDDHPPERPCRHLDSMQCLTHVHPRPPRVACLKHGVKQVRLPWAEPGSDSTNPFQASAITVLRATNVRYAGPILGISGDETWHIMEQAVNRGRAAEGRALPSVLGVGEKAIAKGHRHMRGWRAICRRPR